MNPLVSVIVPIYNTEDYLPRCLDSLIGQTLSSIEFLLIMDANSNLESYRIVEEYCRRDSRMKMLTGEARGASAVRNTGLREAQGEYIGFVDSDDYVRPSMFADLHNFAAAQSLDIVVSGILRDNVDSESLQTFMLYPEEITRVPDTTRRDFMYKWVLAAQANSIWNKLYRRSLLEQHGIRFDESIRMSEDGVFNAVYFSLAQSAGSITQANYVYFNRPGSMMYTIDTNTTLRDFQLRWDVFKSCASELPDGDALLAITSLRLIANAIFFFKVRNQSLEEACRFTSLLTDKLGMQPFLDVVKKPGVLEDFAKQANMNESALSNFRKFAEAAAQGEKQLLEWQLYYTKIIEKKG